MPKNTIIIIEEQAEMVAASCVPAERDYIDPKPETLSLSHHDTESAGELYSRILQEMKDLSEVIMVDPRNPLYLFPKLIKEVITNRVPFLQALKTVFLYRVPAVIVNGKLISSGQKTFTRDFDSKIKSELK